MHPILRLAVEVERESCTTCVLAIRLMDPHDPGTGRNIRCYRMKRVTCRISGWGQCLRSEGGLHRKCWNWWDSFYLVPIHKIEWDLSIAISPVRVGSLGFFHICCLWIVPRTGTQSVQEKQWGCLKKIPKSTSMYN